MVCVYNHDYEKNLTIGKTYGANITKNKLSPIGVEI